MSWAIVPAAGASRRMGRAKLLLPFRGGTVAGSLLGALFDAGVERVVVVIATGDDALRSCALGCGAEVAVNPHPERGMLSSVVAGLAALGGAAAVEAAGGPLLVTPADLPAIEPRTIRDLVAALERGAAPLAVPAYRGKRGHPLAVAAALVPEIPALDPEVGLHQLLERHSVTELAVEDRGVIADVDTPSDYASLSGRDDRG